MNNHSTVVLLILTGVCLFAAVRHFSNGFWRPIDKVNIFFGVTCCAAALMAFTLSQLYGAFSVPEYTAQMKWNLFAILWFFIGLHWFIVTHIRQQSKIGPVAVTVIFVALMFANFQMPHGIQLSQLQRIEAQPLLWGESIATPVGTLAPTFWIGCVMGLFVLVHAIVRLGLAWRQERSVTSLLMFSASGLTLLAMIEGVLVRAQWLGFIHLGPFGFFVMVIAMSLTLSFRGHQRLLISEQRFRTLVEQAPFGVQVLSSDGRTLQTNRAWERIWSGNPQSADDFLRPLIEKANAGQAVELGAARIENRWVRSFVYPLVDSAARVRNVIAIYADVTEQKRAEEEARAATMELQEVTRAVLQQERLRALGQMAGGIAHDINNAISPALLYVDFLLEQPADLTPRARERLIVVQQAIAAVVQTVMRLREFSRPNESGFPSDAVDLNRVAGEAIALTHARCESLSAEKKVQYRVEFKPTPALPPISGVESELRDAVINLIFNAIDAMPIGGVVNVRTLESGAGAAIEVSDSGVGMDEATRRRCLEPFFTTKGKQGTGLGLAMVYGMVKRHRGDIEIISEPGLGTTIRLRFGDDVATARSARVPSSPPPADGLSAGAKILIVDDDPAVLQVLRTSLEPDGHAVLTADDGQSGIDAFELAQKSGAPFAAVITDLNMPGLDGQQLSAAIHRTAPGTPVIMLTGWAHQQEGPEESMPLVDHILAKPVNLAELRARLKTLLQERH